MRNRTVLAICWLLILANVRALHGQTPVEPEFDKTKRTMELVDAMGKGNRSKYALDSLMLTHRAPLVMIQSPDSIYIFVPHHGCYVRRHFKGSYEERSAGGDSEMRGKGGDDSGKKKTGGIFATRAADGGSIVRETGGEIAGRGTGGDESNRKQAGARVDRSEGGETADRDMKGDDSQRKTAGKSKQRTEGGETTDRDTKGENTNRSTEGANRRRRWSGAFKLRKKGAETDENVYCQKNLTQPSFQLSNLPNGVTVEVYDVMGLRKVNGLVVDYY